MKAEEIIESVKGKSLDTSLRCKRAIELATCIIEEANRSQTPLERKTYAQLAKMVENRDSKYFTVAVADQCFRSSSNKRTADQLIYLLKKFGAPCFLKRLAIFKLLGRSLTALFIPLFKRRVRKETSNVIIPGEERQLLAHLKRRYSEGVRVNLNHIGEAIHGEEEANRRLQMYLDDLLKPEIEYISVKVSTIFSQLNLLAFEKTISILSNRLKLLYKTAKDQSFTRPNGETVAKFVNLDMEEYRDLHLTVEAFCASLDDPEFLDYSAGIALQAYLPDSFEVQKKLTSWAKKRVASGGAQIKIRLVKGANLAMERVESSYRCWPQAPYKNKEEVDANFKRMLHFACEKENIEASRIGIGSHNIFDIAYALLIRAEKNIEKFVKFEMLEGMADSIGRVIQKLSGDLIFYCPAVEEKDFDNAIAYLTRRLDENTTPDNFLSHIFNLVPGSEAWEDQVTRFSLACAGIDKLSVNSNRTQNRNKEPAMPEVSSIFKNEPDTDWTSVQNRCWIEGIVKTWSTKKLDSVPKITKDEEIKQILARAKSFKEPPLYERTELLEEALQLFRSSRGDLIGIMMAEGHKTAVEADVEVSEAIDFIDYYRRMMIEFSTMEDIKWVAKGVALIAPPWNFPCSIPVGGIAAALATGNSVIFKPAPESVKTGNMIAKIFMQSGFSKEQFQFVSCDDSDIGTALVQDPRVDFVVLTGATETAKHFKQLRPGIDLLAETGGKNTMIVSSLADRDLAIASVIQSAFSHSGQKCSACSLLILEKEIYDCPKFRKQLIDAAASLVVDSSWNLATKVNPLIHAPDEKLFRGLTELESGEEWALSPKEYQPNLWSPGIKYGVQKESFTYKTEFFGPILGVMRADDLDHAIELANGTPYGLTAGVQTLDEREMERWLEKIEAGNCYINRSITGAIVARQPFGGCKESNFGPGLKAGGPNYITQMMHCKQIAMPKKREKFNFEIDQLIGSEECFKASIESYNYYWKNYFSKEHDPSSVLGQDNILRYIPREKMTFRVQEGDSLMDILRVIAAAKICGTKLQVSSESELPVLSIIESEETFISRIEKKEIRRVRIIEHPSKALALSSCNINRGPVLANGRLELLHYLREVSISFDYHRYGNLGERGEL